MARANEFNINNLSGGISTIQFWEMKDNELQLAQNMYYNKNKQLQTRLWYKAYLPKVWTKPITSYFFHQRDDGAWKYCIAVCWDVMYSYDEGTNTRTSIKSWLSEFETNPVFNGARTRRDFAVYNNIVYMCDWVNNYASYNGTTYTEYASQPKCRYLSYLWDRIYGAWEDANPITIYYTGAVPANANTLNANFIKVWWDETGAINGLSELWNLILAVKDAKIYVINPVWGTAQAIDAQGGWFCNRSLKNVWDSIVFFNEKGVDTLKQRSTVTGASALTTDSISKNVVSIFNKVQRKNYNFQCSLFNRDSELYYISIDSNNDTIPDMMLVYSSNTWWWTTYTLPSMFDMGIYIDNNQNTHYVFAWTDWQLYEFDSWLYDYWQEIVHKVKTKPYNQDAPWKIKTYEYVDIIWYKSLWTIIDVNINSEWAFETWWEIIDKNIDYSVGYKTISSTKIWAEPLWWFQQWDEIKMYQYTIRMSLYITWENIDIDMESSWWTRTVDRLRMWINWQPIDVYYSDQYL